MTSDKAKVADRIRKLMAKATGTDNESEAATFMEKAQGMLLEHNLSMEDVNEVHTEDQDTIADREIETQPHKWRYLLGIGVAEMYLCGHVFEPHDRPGTSTEYHKHCFIGTRANVTVAKIMFVYLMNTVEGLAQQGAKRFKTIGEKSKYRTDFRKACVRRLRVRMAQRVIDAKEGGEVKTEEGNTLPALLSLFEKHEAQNEAKKDKEYGENALVAPKSRDGKTLSAEGAADGYDAGDRISLDQQLDGPRKRLSGKE